MDACGQRDHREHREQRGENRTDVVRRADGSTNDRMCSTMVLQTPQNTKLQSPEPTPIKKRRRRSKPCTEDKEVSKAVKTLFN